MSSRNKKRVQPRLGGWVFLMGSSSETAPFPGSWRIFGNVVIIDGDTPLHIAAEFGHKDILVTLLEKGANKDAQGKDGWTPLNLAAYNGKLNILETLIKAEANKDAQTKHRWTPLHWAAENGDLATVKALQEAGART